MNQSRFMHQSLILENRFLFVFFGMESSADFNNSIEFLDLNAKLKNFKVANVK